MKRLLIAAACFLPLSSQASRYAGPDGTEHAKNQEVFARYCVGLADDHNAPDVNWNNEEVLRAARILSKVADTSYYMYREIRQVYVTNQSPPPPAGISKNANTFLRILCGEFRDRATLIASKLRWIHNMVMPGQEPQSTTIDLNRNVWSQLSGHSYKAYLALSDRIWRAKQAARPAPVSIRFGSNTDAEIAVDGQTVCETKYMISEYVAKSRPFDDYAKYSAGYMAFQARCTQADKDYYYDFRGDSNFKPNSPESNAMIWHSISIAKACEATDRSKYPEIVPNEQCRDYFRKPFLSRWNAARAGLSAWLMRDAQFDGDFEDQASPVTIFPHFGEGFGDRPFSFSLDGNTRLASFLSGLDLESNDLGFGRASASPELVYKRLRDAVNRHTNWYQSRYDDKIPSGLKRDQAYSPFVATSYEMSKSDGFTAPGATISAPGDGRKHWMFVFRVHKSNWYNTSHLQQGLPFVVDRMWIDETSFGTDDLADEERAWDRLGSPVEGEFDSIIYLHNLDTSGRAVGNEKLEN